MSEIKINSRSLIYESGDRYGYGTLTGKCYLTGDSQRMVEFVCDCGKIAWSCLSSLKTGHSKSCGCHQKKTVSKIFTTHGLSRSKLYGIWEKMKCRCYNINYQQYSDYGGRGIKICDEWLNNPEVFIKWAENNGWKSGLTIERKDNDIGYTPDNCILATQAVQSRNKRSNIYISAFGENKCVADWVKDIRCKISFNQILYRINKMGWDAEKAISEKSLRNN